MIIDSDIGDPVITFAEGTHASISYDPADRKVKWTQALPLDENTITVVATVGSRETTTEITITNVFEGVTFVGGSNNDPSNDDPDQAFINAYTLEFNSDDNLNYEINAISGMGTWTRTGNTITATYQTKTDIAIQGELIYDDSEAYVEGFLYNGTTVPVIGMEDGYFKIDFQP